MQKLLETGKIEIRNYPFLTQFETENLPSAIRESVGTLEITCYIEIPLVKPFYKIITR